MTIEKKKQQSWQARPVSSLAATVHDLRAATEQSFASASQAARRGRSDPLFRPVASVYAELGRQQREQARAAERELWDAFVERQNPTAAGTGGGGAAHIDLHGVPVADGTRIALRRTQAWWDGLPGEHRVRAARESPFTIITGQGTHSSGGVSQLRQQVGLALERHGWKHDVGTGIFYVTGRK